MGNSIEKTYRSMLLPGIREESFSITSIVDIILSNREILDDLSIVKKLHLDFDKYFEQHLFAGKKITTYRLEKQGEKLFTLVFLDPNLDEQFDLSEELSEERENISNIGSKHGVSINLENTLITR